MIAEGDRCGDGAEEILEVGGEATWIFAPKLLRRMNTS